MTTHLPDPDALAYARYWEPVLADPARRLLGRIATSPGAYLDVGSGTGSLPLAAAARWPDARISGLDASAGMLSVARHRVATERVQDDPARFDWIVADAGAMPLADGTFDAVTSAFMLQLVDDRDTVLREVLRVLRPGGTFAFVTWLADDPIVPADDLLADVVAMQGLDWPDADLRDSRTGDYADVEAARSELDRAGFDGIVVGDDGVKYAWSRDGYLDFKEHFDEIELFESLPVDKRERLREALVRAWAELPEEAFVIRGPLVWAVGHRPAG